MPPATITARFAAALKTGYIAMPNRPPPSPKAMAPPPGGLAPLGRKRLLYGPLGPLIVNCGSLRPCATGWLSSSPLKPSNFVIVASRIQAPSRDDAVNLFL